MDILLGPIRRQQRRLRWRQRLRRRAVLECGGRPFVAQSILPMLVAFLWATLGSHLAGTQGMLTNESSIDRALRVVIGVVLLSLVVAGPKTMWGLFGLIPLLTGLVGFCPLYRVLGLSTCPAHGGRKRAA